MDLDKQTDRNMKRWKRILLDYVELPKNIVNIITRDIDTNIVTVRNINEWLPDWRRNSLPVRIFVWVSEWKVRRSVK